MSGDLQASVNAVLHHGIYFASKGFVNDPEPVKGQGQATVSYVYSKDGPYSQIEYSIVMPVYNQERIIVENIRSAIEQMGGSSLFECILIFDGCDDGSEKRVKEFFETNASRYERLDRVILIHQPTPIFETACDNMGMVLSRGKYIIEVQADMKILTHNYNELLSLPCRLMKEVCGVSGRCCHSWYGRVGIGKLGADFGVPGMIPSEWQHKFFVADTCNRGPLLFDRAKLVELQYLDQQNFYLDDSDHDYFARAKERGWICGYVAIDVYAPIQDGSNRKPRNEENTRVLKMLKDRSNGGFLKSKRMEEAENIQVFDLSRYIQ
jgi:glycosyltransferase involved in cell wall biosynthesis